MPELVIALGTSMRVKGGVKADHCGVSQYESAVLAITLQIA
jgi:hypothetical protein